MRCMGFCVNRVAMSVNQFELWTVSNDVKSLATSPVLGLNWRRKQPQTMTGSTTRSTRQAVIQFAPCVLPARSPQVVYAHLRHFLFCGRKCSRTTVLLFLGLARKVCDRSARGTIFAPELFRRNVTGDMRSPWTLSVVLMSKSSENRVGVGQ